MYDTSAVASVPAGDRATNCLEFLIVDDVRSICDNIIRKVSNQSACSVVCAGDHLREVGTAVYCTCPVAGGTELPCHLYSPWYAPGREVSII